MNGIVVTFEIAPLFTLMEGAFFDDYAKKLGWNSIDGIFCPGGSMANMYAIISARYKLYPEVKEKGVFNLPRMRILTSEESHYSLKKFAMVAGLGTDSIVEIKSDDEGCMIPSDLENHILAILKEGEIPLMVNATLGTTVLGAIDPIKDISEICKKYKIWLHVDAAFGGTCIISKLLKHKTEGVAWADSLTWDPHKHLPIGQQCTVFVTKHKGLLK